jgi:hypothetical protein
MADFQTWHQRCVSLNSPTQILVQSTRVGAQFIAPFPTLQEDGARGAAHEGVINHAPTVMYSKMLEQRFAQNLDLERAA